MQKHTNTYDGGLDQDTSKNKYSKNRYYNLENLRRSGKEGSSTNALENIDGNKISFTLPSGQYLAGSVELGDSVILFTSDDATTPTNYIFKVEKGLLITSSVNIDIDDSAFYYSNTYTSSQSATVSVGQTVKVLSEHTSGGVEEAVYENTSSGAIGISSSTDYSVTSNWTPANHKVYTGALNINTSCLVEGIGRKESDTNQKVYFIDSVNSLTAINIVTGDLIEILPDASMTAPEINSIISGDLYSGKIQYAYQLFTSSGSETMFSPTSYLTNLTRSSESQPTTTNYKGSDVEVNTGKGIELSITYPSGFDEMKVLSIHYSSLNSDPIISIIQEIDISDEGGSITITDSGSVIDSLTLSEFRVLTKFIPIADTIAQTKEKLFLGNVNEEYFDIDDVNGSYWDARAFRYRASDSTSKVYEDSAGSSIYYTITSSGNWTKTGGGGGTGTDWLLPEDADCINEYNIISNDGVTTKAYNFQSDGTTIGGEGLNINYTFSTEKKTIAYMKQSSTYSNHDYTLSATYADPILSNSSRSVKRDETYRCGIIWKDEKGRSSYVKWIGDIRTPSPTDDSDYDIASNFGDYVKVQPLFIDFEVNNVPTGYDVQIVVVRKDDSDRTNLFQGLMCPVVRLGNSRALYENDIFHPVYKIEEVGGSSYANIDRFDVADEGDLVYSNRIFQIYSPEISYGKYTSIPSEGIVRMIGLADDIDLDYNTASLHSFVGISQDVFMMRSNLYFTSTIYSFETEDGFVVDPVYGDNADSGNVFIGSSGDRFVNYLDWAGESGKAVGGTSFLGYASANISSNIPGANGFILVDYKVDRIPYKGHTYEDRALSTYTPFSESTTPIAGTASITCTKGDTFIVIYEFLRKIFDLEGASSIIYSSQEIGLIPVETYINTYLRLDSPTTKFGNNTPISSPSVLMQEYSGTHQTTYEAG